jgi:hypothetical protein
MKEYLGDGVYADFDGWSIVLTTENGICATNTIVLEPEVLRSLDSYLERLRTRK